MKKLLCVRLIVMTTSLFINAAVFAQSRAQMGEKKYRLRANHLSKHYTTDISELPEIN